MFVASKYCLRLNGTKIVKQINVGKIIEWGKYQLIFVTAEEVSSRPFLFWLKKKRKKKTAHFTHRLYVCLFLSDDSASGF